MFVHKSVILMEDSLQLLKKYSRFVIVFVIYCHILAAFANYSISYTLHVIVADIRNVLTVG